MSCHEVVSCASVHNADTQLEQHHFLKMLSFFLLYMASLSKIKYPQLVYIVDYIDRFSYVEPSLHQAYLIMVDDLFDVYLNCVYAYFIEYFCINIHGEIALSLIVSCQTTPLEEIPLELQRLVHGSQVNLDMEDHQDQEYIKPRLRFKAFSGEGQKLGSLRNCKVLLIEESSGYLTSQPFVDVSAMNKH
ncbi:hypothetical protein STEG23_027413 [Scotinomys teguina]